MRDALRTPVRPAAIARLVGLAARPTAIACAVPAAVAAATGDGTFALRAALVAAAFAGLGALGRGGMQDRIQRNEALVVAASMFVLIPLGMAWPFSGGALPFGDAVFEAVSGITTTGLSVVDVGDASTALLFGRAWLQWLGGLGIVLLSLAVIIPPGSTSAGLDENALTHEGLGSTRSLARRVVLVHVGLTVLGIGVLLALGETALRATAYPLASLSTGGFSPDPEGLAALGTASQAVVTSLCVIGATPALLLAGRMRVPDRRTAWIQCGVMLALIAVATAGVAARQVGDGLWDAALLATSAQTTAGFSTVDVAGLDAGAKAWLLLSMSIGGPTGSTAGGIKVLRLVIAFRLAVLAVERTAMPRHAVVGVRVGHQRLEPETLAKALLLIVLALGTIAASWLPFVLHGHDPLDALFEVISATGTVGLSSGLTTPELAPALKAVLCADMLLGRLEFLALIVLLYPRTWFGPRRSRTLEEES